MSKAEAFKKALHKRCDCHSNAKIIDETAKSDAIVGVEIIPVVRDFLTENGVSVESWGAVLALAAIAWDACEIYHSKEKL